MTGQPTRYAQHQLTCSLPGWQVVISDYQQMDRILKEERNYILQMIKKIRASGCNVLLIQKSILRDAVTDLSLHYLVRAVPPVVTEWTLTWSCGKEHGHVHQMPAPCSAWAIPEQQWHSLLEAGCTLPGYALGEHKRCCTRRYSDSGSSAYVSTPAALQAEAQLIS